MTSPKNFSGPLMLAWLGLALLAGLVRGAEAAPLCETCGPTPARSYQPPAPIAVPPPAMQAEELAAGGAPDSEVASAPRYADPGTPGLQRSCRGLQKLDIMDAYSSEYGIAIVDCDHDDFLHGGR